MTRNVRFRDLRISDAELRTRLLSAMARILDHGQFLMGEEVAELEGRVAAYCGTRHCVGVGSGTGALYLALRALDIGPGDEVVTPALSWIATSNAIRICGATPVFVDIGNDLNIDASTIPDAITDRTKAILPVHFAGRLCDMERIAEIAASYRLSVIEDAAQAFGASRSGRMAGSFGNVAAFSFNPMKVLPSGGEAGAVVTNDEKIWDRLNSLRYLGTVDKETCVEPCLNFKIDTMQAAFLLEMLPTLDGRMARRGEIAHRYHDRLSDLIQCPDLPMTPTDRSCIFFDFHVSVDDRREMIAYLEARGIEVKIRHPILMPDQPANRDLPRPAVPNARRLVERILCLPIHEKMTDRDVDYVSNAIREFVSA